MKINYIIILFVVFISIPMYTISQNKLIDSLALIVENHPKKDTVRVLSLSELFMSINKKDSTRPLRIIKEIKLISDSIAYKKGEAIVFFLKGKLNKTKKKYDKAIEYFNKAGSKYQNLNLKFDLANCYREIGHAYNYKDDFDNGLKSYTKALKLYEDVNDIDGVSLTLGSLSVINSMLGNYNEALLYANKSLVLSIKRNSIDDIYENYNTIASTNYRKGNYPQALKYFNKSLELKEKIDNKSKIADVYNNIGLVYKIIDEYDLAIEYHNKSIEVCKENNNTCHVLGNNFNIGELYRVQKKYDKAREYLEETLRICEERKLKYRMVTCLNALGNLSIDVNDFDKGLLYLNRALKIIQKISKPIKKEESYTYYKIASVYYNKKNYKKALSNAMRSLKIANKIGKLNQQIDSYKLLSEIYEKKKDFKKAYINHIKYKRAYDSVVNQENIKKIARIEFDYKYNEQLKKTEVIKKNLIEEVENVNSILQKSYRYIFWILLGAIILAVFFGLNVFRQKLKDTKAENKQIAIEQKLLRSQMTPHFIFNSLSVLQGMVLNKENDKAVTYVSKFSRLLRTILENSREKNVSIKDELNTLQNYVDLQNMRSKHKIKFIQNVDSKIYNLDIYIPPMIIQPFVENAIIHAFDKDFNDAKIIISIKFLDKKLICKIIDNGIGTNLVKTKRFNRDNSLATKITSERLQILSKEYRVVSSLKVEDRSNYNEHGTQVTILLPYKINNYD